MDFEPTGFMSYARTDDDYEEGRLSLFHKRLSGEISAQLGRTFRIFLDRDIKWGEPWRKSIEDSLGAVTVFIAIVTPTFFRSEECCKEVRRFLDREKELGRRDLLLPVHYITNPAMDRTHPASSDELVKIIAGRQYEDWRPFRHKALDSEDCRLAIERIGKLIVERVTARSQGGASTTSLRVRRPDGGVHAKSGVRKESPPSDHADPVVGAPPASSTDARAENPADLMAFVRSWRDRGGRSLPAFEFVDASQSPVLGSVAAGDSYSLKIRVEETCRLTLLLQGPGTHWFVGYPGWRWPGMQLEPGRTYYFPSDLPTFPEDAAPLKRIEFAGRRVETAIAICTPTVLLDSFASEAAPKNLPILRAERVMALLAKAADQPASVFSVCQVQVSS